jgi:hypothetical protein
MSNFLHRLIAGIRLSIQTLFQRIRSFLERSSDTTQVNLPTEWPLVSRENVAPLTAKAAPRKGTAFPGSSTPVAGSQKTAMPSDRPADHTLHLSATKSQCGCDPGRRLHDRQAS